MLNKFRYVDYDDDGCSIYECLSCYERWSARYFGEKYCGYCGAKWDGPHGDLLNRKENYGPRRKRIEDAFEKRGWVFPKDNYFRWVIEERVKWPNSEWGEWKRHSQSYGWLLGPQEWSSSRFLSYYKDLSLDTYHSEDDFLKFEFRVKTEKI